MGIARRAEVIVGGAAFLLGLIGAIILWFVPVSSSQFQVINNTTHRVIHSVDTSTSLTAFAGTGTAIALVSTLAILSLWVLLAALRSSVLMAWLAVVALVVFSVATAMEFAGAPLLIALLAAVSAAIISTRRLRGHLAHQL